MKEIIERKKDKQPIMVINPDLNKYNGKVLFPKKLKEANETLSKYPLPADILMESYSKTEQEKGFTVSGILRSIDAKSNTFLVVKMEGEFEIHFKIYVKTKMENEFFKINLGENIKVIVKPVINEKNQFEYELLKFL
jgi:hypothetical protein